MRCPPNGNQALDQLAQRLGRHAEHPPVRDSPAGRQVDAVLVPGPEAAGPASRHVHRADHGVLATDVADQVDRRRRGAPTRSPRAHPRWNSVHAGHDAAPRCRRRPARRAASSVRPSNRLSGAEVVERASDRRQVAVHEVDRHRALADGRRDPLHRVEPHVAGREHPGHAGLQRERRTRQRPRGCAWAGPSRSWPGDDEALVVADDVRAEPVGARRGADEDEQPAAVTSSVGRSRGRRA